MGLDITAYERAARLEPQPEKDENGNWPDSLYDDESTVHVFAYAAFEHALRGLPYVADNQGDWDAGWYLVGGATAAFRAGSYGGYGEFRKALAVAAVGTEPREIWNDVDAYRGRPFFGLIHFADNEGTIGPQTCAGLAADFAEQRETVLPKWDPEIPDQAWFREKYDAWQQAFELAAGTGLVRLS